MESIAKLILLETLESADKVASLALNSLHTGFTDWFWTFMSDREVWFPLYFVVAVLLFVRCGWKRGLVIVLACALAVAACDQFSNFCKDLFLRLRPCWDADVAGRLHLLEGRYDSYGFYSAHAANAMTFAVCTTLGFKTDERLRYRGYMYGVLAWAVLVGVSRVFVGKHFLGDVVVGFVVGALFAYIIFRLFYAAGRLVFARQSVNA